MAGADKFLGVSLYAAKPLKKEKPIGKAIYTFKKGDFVGIIDSWVVRNGKIYWAFYENNKFDPAKDYYVQHDDNSFEITPQIKRILDLEKKKAVLKDQAELQQYKGTLPEGGEQSLSDKIAEAFKTYFPWIVGAALAAVAIKAYINKKA